MSYEAKVNRFLLELWSILESNRYRGVVAWTGSDSFTILNQERFYKECMQEHFRSNSIHSFYRQLNMYGFRFRLTGEKLRSWSHPCFTPDRNKLQQIERKHENKKLKKKQPSHPRSLQYLEAEVRKLNQTLQMLVYENKAMREKLDGFERGMTRMVETRQEKQYLINKPKKSIIKKKVDFYNEEKKLEVPSIVESRPIESESVAMTSGVLRPISLIGLYPNTQEHDLLFRRSRRNSRLLSIKIMDEQEHCRDMLEQTRHNLPMSRAITVLNEVDTSKIID